jgi:hypothetical protein
LSNIIIGQTSQPDSKQFMLRPSKPHPANHHAHSAYNIDIKRSLKDQRQSLLKDSQKTLWHKAD